MRPCRQCKGRDGAHFGWCTTIGGGGRSATPLFQEPTPAPAAPRVTRRRPAVRGVGRDDIAAIAQAIAVDAVLREARASVALDRDQTHTFPVGTPDPPLPPGETRRSMSAPRAPAAPRVVCGGCGKSAATPPVDWLDTHKGWRCAECAAETAEAVLWELIGDSVDAPLPEPLPPRAGPRLTLVPPHPDPATGEGAEQPKAPPPFRWGDLAGDVDWSATSVALTASQLLEACQRGLPGHIRFDYSPDVLATEGLQFDSCDAAVRDPERVEIRPETKDKGYPVLRFDRGDVQVILGMRVPTRPRVIAAYYTSLLAHDTHRVSSAGGGGARKREGMPGTVRALVKALRLAGVTFPDGFELAGGPVEVSYGGQPLGKLSLAEGRSKVDVRNDWQRFRRRVEAIKLREAAGG